jgi:hypothetical protein
MMRWWKLRIAYVLGERLTWPLRTNGLSFRVMPAGGIFSHKGPAAFVDNDSPDDLLALVCLVNSKAFGLLVSVQLARVELAQSFEVGLIQQTPVPDLTPAQRSQLATLARRAWSLKRRLDTITETSHAFLLPLALRQAQAERLGTFDPAAIEAELARIQGEIDDHRFRSLRLLRDRPRTAALGSTGGEASDGDTAAGRGGRRGRSH